MTLTRWKVGDKVCFDMADNMFESNDLVFGTVRNVLERVGADTLYSIKWDDGFEDGADNMIAEWELSDPSEVEHDKL